MDPIDLLEQRIAALELQILPQEDANSDEKNSQVVCDLLLQTHTMIESALSCREIITSTLQKMEIINKFLDPRFCDNIMEPEAKRNYIIELYPELKKWADSISQFKRLQPILNSDSLINVSPLLSKLQNVTIANMELYNESKTVSDNIKESLEQYNNIILSIQALFSQLETNIADCERLLQDVTRS